MMRAVSYARPRLTTTEDKRYRAHVEQFLIQRKNQRAIRPPRQRDIFGGQAESALRDWLATHSSLSHQRILEYEERRGKRAHVKYRELDAVIIDDRRTIQVFEMKASRAASSLYRASAQLRETRAILHLLYPSVHTTILLVDTGIPTAEEIAELMAAPDAPLEPPQTLAEAIAQLDDVHLATSLDERKRDPMTIDLLLFSVADIIALAGEENLALDWSADDELDDTPPPSAEPAQVYTSSDDSEPEEGGGALAEALRRAGLGT